MALHFDKAKNRMAAGDYLAAYDLSCLFLADHGDNLNAQHFNILALARAGNADHAARLFLRSTLMAHAGRDDIDLSLKEDILGLRARIAKDMAFTLAPGPHRQRALLRAARLYMNGYQETDGYYTGINAATLYFLSEQQDSARQIIKQLIPDLEKRISRARTLVASGKASEKDTLDLYFKLASRAEAALLTGDEPGAQSMIDQASQFAGIPADARAATVKQLARIAKAAGCDFAWLDGLRPKTVLHYAGHIYGCTQDQAFKSIERSGNLLDQAHEAALRQAIHSYLTNTPISTAYGCLAAGSDILIAETLLEHGVDVHLVLPNPIDRFLETSIKPMGDRWLDRFNKIVPQAAATIPVCEAPDHHDALIYQHISDVAMGLAVKRAGDLATDAQQLLIWDRVDQPTGTARDKSVWADTGHGQHIIDYPARKRQSYATFLDASGIVLPTPVDGPGRRQRVSVLFADIKGYSQVAEADMPAFHHHILTPLAALLAGLDEPPLMQKSWGDGLCLGFHGAKSAAEAALAIRDWMLSDAVTDQPFDINIRIALHAAPAWVVTDPVSGQVDLFGREISRAARIEPQTLPGYIYVTDAMTAALSLEAPGTYRTVYVGHKDLRGFEDGAALYSLDSRAVREPAKITALLDSLAHGLTDPSF